MPAITGNSDFGRDLCRALGLDGMHVSAITLHAESDEIVTVTAKMNVIDKQAGEVVSLLKKYKIVPLEIDD